MGFTGQQGFAGGVGATGSSGPAGPIGPRGDVGSPGSPGLYLLTYSLNDTIRLVVILLIIIGDQYF